MQVTVFFDGFCPLCQMEMTKLAQLDTRNRLVFEDIQRADFSTRFPDLNWQDLNNRIHVMTADGEMVTGLDATHLAWQQVGKGWVYAPLRWPIIRWFADWFYLFFARNRMQISYLLTGKKRCQSCELPTSAKTEHVKSKKEQS